jgi:EpsI family protein
MSAAARMTIVAALMALTAMASAALKPRSAPSAAAPDLQFMLPDDFGAWRRVAVSEAVLPAEAELGPGEAVAYGAYKDEFGRVVTLVAAYGPALGDSVRLHRPEKCYSSQGYEILERKESLLEIRGRMVPVIDLATKGPSREEAVSYWLREGRGFSLHSGDNAWRRLKGAQGPTDSALIRISSPGLLPENVDLHRRFLLAFAQTLDPEASSIFLGADAPP